MTLQENYIQQMLVSLRTRLLVMGASVEIAVDNMANAVTKMDLGTAQAVIDNDDTIDELENEIDESALSLLARTQPVACDLRFVVSTLRMVVDMERIGDEAASICSQILLMKDTPANMVMDLVGEHLKSSVTAFRRSMEVLRSGDPDAALAMKRLDDEALQSEVAIVQRLVGCPHKPKKEGENEEGVYDTVFLMHVILMVHSLTRIWRRAANIAGHVYFTSLGDSIKHPVKEKKELLHF